MSKSSKPVFETPWFSITEIPISKESEETYYCVSRANGVVCMLLTDDAELVMAEQWRPPLRRTTIEMPAGAINPGEQVAYAAEREITEETGYEFDELKYITPLRLMLNREDVIEHFFIALGARPVPNQGPLGNIKVVHMKRHELLKQIVEGTFDQSVALTGIYIAEKIFSFRFFEDEVDVIINALKQ